MLGVVPSLASETRDILPHLQPCLAMSSEEVVQTIQVNKIQDMEGRVRQNPGDIRGLATSLQNNGQIQPIVLHEGSLVVGWRRCMAALLLQSEENSIKGLAPGEIKYLERSDLSPYELAILEYEENKRRKPFEKAEEAIAIARLKSQLEAIHGKTVTHKQLARELGYSTAQITFAITVADAVSDESSLSKKEKKALLSKSSIAGAYRDLKSNEKLKKLLKRAKAAEAEAEEAGTSFTYEEHVVLADCMDIMPGFPDASFDLIHLDPPWGIGVDSYDRQRNYGTFDDSASVAEAMSDFLIPEAYRLLNDDTYLLLWFGIQFYAPLMQRLTDAGFTPNPVPYIWYKTDKKGSQNDPTRTVQNAYEPLIIAAKGDPRMYARADTNVLEHPMPTKRTHFAQKPVKLLKDLLTRFSFGKMRVLDPTFGSGAFLVAAQALERDFYGIEKDQDNYDNALSWLKTTHYIKTGEK